jgi:hypothetical protein
MRLGNRFWRLLMEGSDCELRVFKDFKKGENADQLESLHGEFGGIEEFQGAAALLDTGEEANEQPDSAGIKGRNFLKVQKEARVAFIEQVGHGRVKPIEWLTEVETAAESYDFHIALSADFNLQEDSSRAHGRHAEMRTRLRYRTVVCCGLAQLRRTAANLQASEMWLRESRKRG